MSVAHLPGPALSVDLAEASGRDEKVIFYCLSCNRSRDANAAVFLGLLGPVPFGMLIGKLKCSRCREKLAVLLPWYAPTPALWVKQYKPEAPKEKAADLRPWDFIYQVDSWGKNDVLLETRTATMDLEVADFAFQREAEKMRADDHYTLRSRTRLIRDSARDFRVVE